MKQTVFMLMVMMVFNTLLGCSKDSDLPYALSGEKFRIIYVVPEEKTDEHFERFSCSDSQKNG